MFSRKRKISDTSSISLNKSTSSTSSTPEKVYAVCFVDLSLPRFELFHSLTDANAYAARQIDDWVKDASIKKLPGESCVSIISQDKTVKLELEELRKEDWFVYVEDERIRSVAKYGLSIRSWVESLGRRRWVAKSKQREDAMFEVLVMERPIYDGPDQVVNTQSTTQPPKKITALEAENLKKKTEETCFLVTYDIGEDGREGQPKEELYQCFRSLEAANKLVRQGYRERVLKMEEQFYIDGMKYDDTGKLSVWLWGEFLEFGTCEGMIATQLLEENVRFDNLNETEVGTGMLTVKYKTDKYDRKLFLDEEVYYNVWEDRRAVAFHTKMRDVIKAKGDIFGEYKKFLNDLGLHSGGKDDQFVNLTTEIGIGSAPVV